jgi:UDP-N-acetylglucosamine:LPS N-acetylglucosamine transferase
VELGRRIALRVLYGVARSSPRSLIDAERPDVVISTYPGITAPLGVMGQRGQLQIPVCALVTDLSSLHFWAHPGADLHLASYPESSERLPRSQVEHPPGRPGLHWALPTGPDENGAPHGVH